jgi:hypothetical protein
MINSLLLVILFDDLGGDPLPGVDFHGRLAALVLRRQLLLLDRLLQLSLLGRGEGLV